MRVVRTTPQAILWASMQQHQNKYQCINSNTVDAFTISDVFLHFILKIYVLGVLADSGLLARLLFSMTGSFFHWQCWLFQVRKCLADLRFHYRLKWAEPYTEWNPVKDGPQHPVKDGHPPPTEQGAVVVAPHAVSK